MHSLFNTLEALADTLEVKLQRVGFMTDPYIGKDFIFRCRESYESGSESLQKDLLPRWTQLNKSLSLQKYLQLHGCFQSLVDTIKADAVNVDEQHRKQWIEWMAPLCKRKDNLSLLGVIYATLDTASQLALEPHLSCHSVIELHKEHIQLPHQDHFLIQEIIYQYEKKESVIYELSVLMDCYRTLGVEHRSPLWLSEQFLYILEEAGKKSNSILYNSVIRELLPYASPGVWKTLRNNKYICYALEDYEKYSWDVMAKIRANGLSSWMYLLANGGRTVKVDYTTALQTLVDTHKIDVSTNLGSALHDAIKLLDAGLSLHAIQPFIEDIEQHYNVKVFDSFLCFDMAGIPVKEYPRQYFQELKKPPSATDEIKVHF